MTKLIPQMVAETVDYFIELARAEDLTGWSHYKKMILAQVQSR